MDMSELSLNAAQTFIKQGDSQSSLALRQFWYSKAAQILHRIVYLKTEEQHTANHLLETIIPQVKTFETSLSPMVRKFGFINVESCDETSVNFLTPGGLLDWDMCSKSKMLGDKTPDSPKEAYIIVTPFIKQVAVQAHHHIMNLDMLQFSTLYGDKTCIIQYPTLFQFFFEEQKKGNSLGVMLMASTWLENTLANTIHQHKDIIETAFRTLDELLDAPEVLQILGEDKIFFIRSFIGPRTALNLRNLTWHGFYMEHEFYSPFSSLLLVMMFSLKDLLVPYINWKGNYSCDIFKEKLSQCGTLSLDISGDLDSIYSLIDRSAFVVTSSEPIWKRSFQYYMEGNYYASAAHLFSLLEPSLRRIWVSINNIPHGRFTAEGDIMFSTLDIILNRNLKRELYLLNSRQEKIMNIQNKTTTSAIAKGYGEEKILNKLFSELGQNMSNIIHNIMVFGSFNDPVTPFQFRSQLAHAKIDPYSVAPFCVDHVIAVALTLLVQYDPHNFGPEYVQNSSVSIERSVRFVSEYVPCYHPKVRILRRLDELVEKGRLFRGMVEVIPGWNLRRDEMTTKLKEIEKLFYQETEAIATNLSHILQKIRSLMHQLRGNDRCLCLSSNSEKPQMSDYPIQSPISTRETSMYTHFSVIIEDCINIMEKVTQAYLELNELVNNRKARTRHRLNFVNLLHFVPFYAMVVSFFILVMEVALSGRGYCKAFVIQNSETDFSGRCCSVTSHLCSLVNNNEWRRVVEVVNVFISPTPKMTGLLSVSPVDARVLWGDIGTFLINLELLVSQKK